jgi:hypothetical protein
LAEESYVFNVAAQEVGVSGVRDTAVWVKTSVELEKQGYALDLPPEGEGDCEAERSKVPMAWKHTQTCAVLKWAQDPYESDFEGPCLCNSADAPEHDEKFPQHPLTRVRFALRCLAQGVSLSAELKKRAKHRGN